MNDEMTIEFLRKASRKVEEINEFIISNFHWWESASNPREEKIQRQFRHLLGSWDTVKKTDELSASSLSAFMRIIFDSNQDLEYLLNQYNKEGAEKELKDTEYLRHLLELFRKDVFIYLKESEENSANSSTKKTTKKRAPEKKSFREELPRDQSSTNDSPASSSFEKLALHSRGEKVKEIQTALKQMGFFKQPIDSIYGPATEVAVRGFQTDYELPRSGVVDEETYRAILRIASQRSQTKKDIIAEDYLNKIKISGSIFGYNILIKEGDKIIAIEGDDKPELRIGMKVVLSGDSRGYVPSGFKPGEQVTITGFNEPFSKGGTDHIIKVSNGEHDGLVKPSNIERILKDDEDIDEKNKRKISPEIVNDLVDVANEIQVSFNQHKSKFPDWYTGSEIPIGSETATDAELKFSLNILLQTTDDIVQRKTRYLNNEIFDGGTFLIYVDADKLSLGLQSIITFSTQLLDYYKSRLGGVYAENFSILNELKKIAESNRSELIPIELAIGSAKEEQAYQKRNKGAGFTEETKYYNKFSLSIVSTDSVDGKLQDDLKIMEDVTALASVIAYRKVTPPLAIGLFGNWGSGKSFFMKMLEEQIEKFSKKASGEYYKNIVHIKFNSWHYSDANLWASLVTKIFDELNKKGDNNPDKLQKLYSELDSVKELFKEAEQQQAKIGIDIDKLNEKNTALQDEIDTSAKNLKGVSVEQIVDEIF